MSYRPYPNVDRALAQLHRHASALSVVEGERRRPPGERFARLWLNTRLAAEQGFGENPGEYRLSTR